jgi:hypothetical protein
MVSTDERLKILKMVQEGKLSADQAVELLEMLDKSDSVHPAKSSNLNLAGRWLRVRVTDTNTGKVRVNVRLPLSVVSSGIKMGMKFSPQVEGLDVNQLMEVIQSGEMGQIVDVVDEEDGEHVEVFVD